MIEDYEKFSSKEIEILSHFVTNTTSNVFVLKNLPDVIKGALFSRYSRSRLGLRTLLMKEFIQNEETDFNEIAQGANAPAKNQLLAIARAQNFYDRILDGYGDDSIAELGGAHVAFENVSMLAAKVLEDQRIGGSPLEKSTRYLCFDNKIEGNYQFYHEPILMASAFREKYLETCNDLFSTYSELVSPLMEKIEKNFSLQEGVPKSAYNSALRSKALDCLRGLLPASALTNLGIFGNGRFFETMIQKMHVHSLSEIQDLGGKAFCEINKIIPSFIRRSEPHHKHHVAFEMFHSHTLEDIQSQAKKISTNNVPNSEFLPGVFLLSHDPEAVIKVAASLLFPHTHTSLLELQSYCRTLSPEALGNILDSHCSFRENRRHKSGRGLEEALFSFEIVGDFGTYRDLQRHRLLSQQRQLLTCDLGYTMPAEVKDTPMEDTYRAALHRAKDTFDLLREEFPEEAQYVVPMAYNLRWNMTLNLRAAQWLTELRSSPLGHPNYRYIAQEIAQQISEAVPEFERFFKFVDFDGYILGRLDQESRIVNREKAKEQA